MKTEIYKKHEKANVYKKLCIHANDLSVGKIGTPLPKGWHVIKCEYCPKTNFKGIVYRNGREVVFCFSGTDKKSIQDHFANIKMAVTGVNSQMLEANEFFTIMKKRYTNMFDEITLVGHSEGGSEAAYVGIMNSVKTVTFNAYGISKRLLNKNRDYDELITNYRHPKDIVSKLRENAGKTFIVPSHKLLTILQSHGIKNIGDCCNAIPIEDYKKLHKLF